MSKSIAHRIPGAGAMLLVTLLAITLSMAACGDDAESVRQANESAAASSATAETPSPSAEIQVTELMDGDCVNSTLPEGISIDTVVIVPCSGDWGGYVNRCVNDIRRRPSQPLPQRRFHRHIERRDRRLPSAQGPSDA